MIAWLLWRDLAMMTRLQAVWIAVAAQILVLAFTVIMWGDGIPVLAGSPLEQFAFVWRTMLIAILPWIAARCSVAGASQICWTAALTGSAPQMVLHARVAALSVMLSAAVVAALPLYVLAFRIGGGGEASIASGLASMFALCPFAATVVTAVLAARGGRVMAWLIATVATATVVLVPVPGGTFFVLAATAGVLAFSTARAERQLAFPFAHDARD